MHDKKFYGLEHEIDGARIGDILVRGKKIRDYKPDEFNSVMECNLFAADLFVKVKVGDDLCHVIGQEFHDAFYANRSRMIKTDEAKGKLDRVHEMVQALFGKDAVYEVLMSFEYAHVGWEMDNDYSVIRHNGEIKYLGTNHGGACWCERTEIEGMLKDVEAQAADLRDALNFT
jgi:hypothetical protein